MEITIPIKVKNGNESNLPTVLEKGVLALTNDSGRIYYGTDTNIKEVMYSHRITQAITFYIDSTNGSDSNDGKTPETAFASFVPLATKISNYCDNITINIAEGTYSTLILKDITAKLIQIRGKTSDVTLYSIASISMQNVNADVRIEKLNFIQVISSISATRCSSVYIKDCLFKKQSSLNAINAIYSNVKIENCEFASRKGCSSQFSRIVMRNCTGSVTTLFTLTDGYVEYYGTIPISTTFKTGDGVILSEVSTLSAKIPSLDSKDRIKAILTTNLILSNQMQFITFDSVLNSKTITNQDGIFTIGETADYSLNLNLFASIVSSPKIWVVVERKLYNSSDWIVYDNIGMLSENLNNNSCSLNFNSILNFEVGDQFRISAFIESSGSATLEQRSVVVNSTTITQHSAVLSVYRI